MIINIADSISSLLQSMALIYISNYCTKKIYQKSSKDLIAMVVILWAIVEITTGLVGNSSLGTIFIHLVMLISLIIIFK